MTPYLSEKIRNLSFFSMLLVVLLHGQLISISTGYVLWIQRLVSGELTRIAVPLFFAISGYLFFQNFSKPAYIFFRGKIHKRFYTILLPYLFWSILGIVFLYLMQTCLPNSSFFSRKLITEYSLVDILYTIFINPIGTYQLWFLKDLFILILFTPIIYWGIKYLRFFLILLLCFFWINGIQYFIQIESIFFFVLGGYIALEYKSILYKKYSQKIIAILKFCIWLIFCGFLVEYNLGYYSHCIGILLGIWSLWCMYDVLYSYIRRINNLKKLAGYSFFIYVAHEPLLTVIKKLLLCIGGSPIMILIIYFMAPLITICVCVVIGCLLKDRFPKFYAFISGGR